MRKQKVDSYFNFIEMYSLYIVRYSLIGMFIRRLHLRPYAVHFVLVRLNGLASSKGVYKYQEFKYMYVLLTDNGAIGTEILYGRKTVEKRLQNNSKCVRLYDFKSQNNTHDEARYDT